MEGGCQPHPHPVPAPAPAPTPTPARREYSKAFVGEESKALRAHRGIWVLGGSLEYPAEWRRHERQGGAHTAAPYVPPPGEGAEGRQQAVAARAAAGVRGAAAEPGAGCGGGGLWVKGNVGAGGERIYHVPGARGGGCVRRGVAEHLSSHHKMHTQTACLRHCTTPAVVPASA